ncbi:hypothetical protein [Christiangramia forsetii]|uniref:Uncharacterized protein n=2 Tax=Christiangramia forsetii TaxID=411153 RepID=A0M432_CHRFK|nr:hypothetical protein [Christiangramia forsetii]GGG24358.1 hypothetical protein GCM10011532_04510 [Christiangramia forsetii]CAL67377.1 hypothetical protein GFO_2421 [Christiangramia forsetii KT0803]
MQAYKITPAEKIIIENSIRPNGDRYANGDFFIWELEHKDCGFGVKAEFIEPNIDILN